MFAHTHTYIAFSFAYAFQSHLVKFSVVNPFELGMRSFLAFNCSNLYFSSILKSATSKYHLASHELCFRIWNFLLRKNSAASSEFPYMSYLLLLHAGLVYNKTENSQLIAWTNLHTLIACRGFIVSKLNFLYIYSLSVLADSCCFRMLRMLCLYGAFISASSINWPAKS